MQTPGRTEKIGRRKDPQLSSPHLQLSPLFLCSCSPYSAPFDWTELPVWLGFWSHYTTLCFVSHNSQSLEVAALLCVHPVHKPVAAGFSKQKYNDTIWFLGEDGVRMEGGEVCSQHLTYFPHSAILVETIVVLRQQSWNKIHYTQFLVCNTVH